MKHLLVTPVSWLHYFNLILFAFILLALWIKHHNAECKRKGEHFNIECGRFLFVPGYIGKPFNKEKNGYISAIKAWSNQQAKGSNLLVCRFFGIRFYFYY